MAEFCQGKTWFLAVDASWFCVHCDFNIASTINSHNQLYGLNALWWFNSCWVPLKGPEGGHEEWTELIRTIWRLKYKCHAGQKLKEYQIIGESGECQRYQCVHLGSWSYCESVSSALVQLKVTTGTMERQKQDNPYKGNGYYSDKTVVFPVLPVSLSPRSGCRGSPSSFKMTHPYPGKKQWFYAWHVVANPCFRPLLQSPYVLSSFKSARSRMSLMCHDRCCNPSPLQQLDQSNPSVKSLI